MTSSRRSITTQVIGTIVLVVTLLLAIVGTVAYRQYSAYLEHAFQESLDLEADRFNVALAPAVWNLEHPQIRSLMGSLMRDRRYTGVSVNFEVGHIALYRDNEGRLQDASPNTLLTGKIEHERPILYNGENIGHLRILATDRQLRATLREGLTYFVLTALLLDLLLTVA